MRIITRVHVAQNNIRGYISLEQKCCTRALTFQPFRRKTKTNCNLAYAHLSMHCISYIFLFNVRLAHCVICVKGAVSPRISATWKSSEGVGINWRFTYSGLALLKHTVMKIVKNWCGYRRISMMLPKTWKGPADVFKFDSVIERKSHKTIDSVFITSWRMDLCPSLLVKGYFIQQWVHLTAWFTQRLRRSIVTLSL